MITAEHVGIYVGTVFTVITIFIVLHFSALALFRPANKKLAGRAVPGGHSDNTDFIRPPLTTRNEQCKN